MVGDLLARGLPDVDDRQPVTMPALDLAITALTRTRLPNAACTVANRLRRCGRT